MISKTRGIVLHQVKYSETSIIAYIYTEKYGRQTYMIKGAKAKRARTKANIFQPLILLELEVYHRINKNFQQIKEVKINPVLHTLSNNIIKNSISLFLAELLYRLIKEEEPNKPLFEYIFNSIILLDQLNRNIINFHLFFMVHLTRYIGFLPDNNYSSSKVYFDLLNGKFISSLPSHNYYLTKELSFLLSKILSYQGNDYEIVGMNNQYRSALLEKIIEYYQIHLEGFSNIKSLEVFKEIFN